LVADRGRFLEHEFDAVGCLADYDRRRGESSLRPDPEMVLVCGQQNEAAETIGAW
jgi:hypothetical protein